MKNKAFFPFTILAIFALGCPKRQTGLRLVYAPPPPPAAGQQSQSEPTQAMVIEEPPPPAPAQAAQVEQVQSTSPPEAPVRKRKRPKTVTAATVEVEPLVEPASAPALQPSLNATEAAGLRNRIDGQASDLQAAITRLNSQPLPPASRKTLHDAQMFLDQATQAINAGDLQRSLQLVKKAGLLVSAAKNK